MRRAFIMVRYSTFPTALFLSFVPSPNRDYRHAYALLYAEGHLTRSSPMHGCSSYSMHFESIIPDGTPVYALFMQIDRCDVVPRKSCVILPVSPGSSQVASTSSHGTHSCRISNSPVFVCFRFDRKYRKIEIFIPYEFTPYFPFYVKESRCTRDSKWSSYRNREREYFTFLHFS